MAQCDEKKPSCSFCARKDRFCDYTPRPKKPKGPKPKPYKEPKPLIHPKTSYTKKRKQDVLLWLINHRVEDVVNFYFNGQVAQRMAMRPREGASGTVEKEPRTSTYTLLLLLLNITSLLPDDSHLICFLSARRIQEVVQRPNI